MASHTRRILIAPQWRDTAPKIPAAQENDTKAPDQVITLLGQRVHKLTGFPHATTQRPSLIASTVQHGIPDSGTPRITRQHALSPAPVNLSWTETLPLAHAITCSRSWASAALLSLLQQQACVLDDPSLAFTLEAVQDLMLSLPATATGHGWLGAAALSPPPLAGPVQSGSVELLLNADILKNGCSTQPGRGPGAHLTVEFQPVMLRVINLRNMRDAKNTATI